MSIRSKIYLGFAVVLALVCGIAWLSVRNSGLAIDNVAVFRDQESLLETIGQLERQEQELQRYAIIFSHIGHPTVSKRVLRLHTALEETLDTLTPRLTHDDQRAAHDRLRELLTAYGEAFDRLIQDRTQRDALFERVRSSADVITKTLEADATEVRRGDALRAFARADQEVMRYVESPDSAAVRAAREHIRGALKSLEGDPDLAARLDGYQTDALQMVQAIRGYLFLANVVLAGTAAEISQATASLRNLVQAETSLRLDELDASSARTRGLTSTIAIAAILAGALLAFLVTSTISRALGQMTETFGALAAGDARAEIPCLDRHDEIGRMAQAAQVFKEKNLETERLLEVAEKRRRQVETQTTELARMNSELEQFAYVASHDLQEPLRMVASYVELLSLDYKGQLSEEADQYITFASEGAKRMQALIHDLLDLSRVGRTDQTPEEVDTAALVTSVQRDLAARLRESGGKVIVEGELPKLRAYRVQLGQVFQNFISNALKYQPEGQAPEIRVRAERTEEGTAFHFEDNGIGIEPRHFERIFLIFQRLHDRKTYEGSGMGLAIVKKIADLHEGKVWVESTPGKGSRFSFLVGNLSS